MKRYYNCADFLEISLDVIEQVSQDEDNSYQIICESLGERLKWDYAEVWLRDALNPQLVQSDICYTTDQLTSDFSKVRKHSIFHYDQGLPGLSWRTKEPVWITNLTTEKRFLRQKEAKKAGLKTCLIVPVIAEDYVDGVIMFFSKKSLEENKHIIKLMSLLSSRLGLNIIKNQLSNMLINYEKEADKNIELISKIFSLRDPYTISHEKFVRNLVTDIGQRLNFTHEEIQDLNYAAALHDIGKISIPMEILSKPARLSHEEFQLIKTHVIAGYELIQDLSFSDNVKRMVLEHHEKLDGSGYPFGKIKDEIYLGSQVLAISDIASAMLENRPYRAAHKKLAVIDELNRLANGKFDSKLIELAIEVLAKYDDDYFTSSHGSFMVKN
jgi:HD-GYP domain-containing protein (c-di-GMP phosphodiesterase class II)